MREVKLLHLYSQTLDLYGDYSNLTAIRRRVEEMGYPCRVAYAELGDPIQPEGYDFIYMGHGKARNLAAVAEHFCSYGQALLDAVERGQLFLVTGNARLLWGKSFETYDGGQQKGIGLFDTTAVETNAVFVSDVVAHPAFDESLTSYGFVNRTSHIVGENPCPLFRVVKGCGDGTEASGAEGNLYHNLFATWQMGPLLARNPAILKELLHRMLGEDYRDFDTSLEEKALALTLKEFDL